MAENNLPTQILVVDDDSTVGQSIEGPLASYKVKVLNTQDLETAFYYFEQQNLEVIFVELDFEPLQGLALIQKFRSNKSPQKRAASFVLMSGKERQACDNHLVKELMDVDLIVKPFSMVNALPFLSRGKAAYQKLLKFEKFREEVLNIWENSKDLEKALEKTRQGLGEFGARTVRFAVELFEKAEKYDDGVTFVAPFLNKESGNNVYLQAKGHLLRLAGRFKEALDPLEKAYNNTPHNLQRLMDLAIIYLELRQPEKSLKLMKELLKLSPEDENLKFSFFQMLSDKGFDDEAREFCKKTTSPMEVVRYYNNKGVKLAKEGDIRGAIKEYETALSFFPKFKENYRIHYNIALARVKFKNRKEYELAMESLKKCLELSPKFDKAQNTMASLAKALGQGQADKKAG